MLTSDWHIHSRNSCDSACLPVADLVSGAAGAGITAYGLTDHIHTPYNLPDLYASREEYLCCNPSADFHFGVEVSVVSQWELDEIASGRATGQTYGLRSGGPAGAAMAIGLTAEDIADLQIEYVVGGTHWPLYVELEPETVIADYHRQNIFLATHPLVNIVAHPWWWMGKWQDADGLYRTEPWLGDFNQIPDSMHEDFAAAAVEHNTAIEINISAMLQNSQYEERFSRQYLEYVALLEQCGVTFSLGSDCHKATYDIDFARAAEQLASLGITDDDLWRLPPRQ
ncbi:MAG: PHP domain-containing protein [Armatimonadota bacterium]